MIGGAIKQQYEGAATLSPRTVLTAVAASDEIVLVDHPTSTWRTAKLGYVIGLADRKAQRATGREFCKKAKPFSVLTEAGMGIG
ncbi:hypothetical protein NSK_003236 [Nannochloropsis salina CCMP1776]|uniref:Uncharacterized protein n=1 Tax=Nannochloropsis salina CCMP1776 TaxID=1027361 RepID=A0A4D9D2F0_9STRA|nr:hypothetical protein NSK_003236 [Nannochloropsis salina CCMP1776]|eukprot:TFJ85732.1 hypothetical protein NSK_003236 [Nannochloropsis salina CCMP1776]